MKDQGKIYLLGRAGHHEAQKKSLAKEVTRLCLDMYFNVAKGRYAKFQYPEIIFF